MTRRPRDRRATDRVEHAGASAKPIYRRLFSIGQAADFAGVSVRAICRWIRMGRLEAYHLAGGRVRIDEVELADFISSPRIPSGRRTRGRTDGSGPWLASTETTRR